MPNFGSWYILGLASVQPIEAFKVGGQSQGYTKVVVVVAHPPSCTRLGTEELGDLLGSTARGHQVSGRSGASGI